MIIAADHQDIIEAGSSFWDFRLEGIGAGCRSADQCLESVDGFDETLADFDGFLVLGDEFPVTLGQGVLKTFVDVLFVHDRFQFQEATKDDHVEHLADAEFLSFCSGGNLVDVDVFAGGFMGDAIGVIDQQATRLHALLKLVKGLLVENDGSIDSVDDG